MIDLNKYIPLESFISMRLADWGGFDYLAYDNRRKVYITTSEEGLYQLRQCEVLFTYSNN
ncbi:hypothetical protein LCGC14_0388410 [marine sediment metagenome]|uniref:Uncharacterized protein n=1 Tax=marine sediment metagenome TaxID=412755 RepID=A0A0F9T5X3_9ZZZZ